MNIALVGSAPSSVLLAPSRDASYQRWSQGKQHKYPPNVFDNMDWEIWACSPGTYGAIARITRFFEVHRWEPGQTWFSPEYCQFLREFNGPVYVGGPIPEIKNAVPYPTDAVEKEFSPFFLTSSLSLMFAVAIMEIEAARATRDKTATPIEDTIGMWGVDMSATEEWEYQRPGCHFFILEALRRGITVFIPPESDILRPLPIYGVSEWDVNYIKATARAKELGARIQAHATEAQRNEAQRNYLQGASDNLQYFVKTWLSPYGLPAGIFLRHQPGTGLGAGREGIPIVDQPAPAPNPPTPEPLQTMLTTATPPASPITKRGTIRKTAKRKR